MREHTSPPDGPAALVARAVLDRAVYSVVRREAHEHMIDTLAQALPHERIILPWLFRPRIGPEDLETLADGLEAVQA
jgi:hypothetical protein